MNCIICNNQGKFLKVVNNIAILRCSGCGLEFCHPIPTTTELKKYYQNYSDIRADEETLLANAKMNIETIEKHGITPSSNVLDFGCGKSPFRKLGGEKWHGCDIGFQDNDFNEKKWECITLWGVLEHLRNPKMTLLNLINRLVVSGLVFFTTVSIETDIPYWHKPPEHLTYWTRTAIELLFAQVGLELIEYRQYWMWQKADIYLSRLLNRTPEEYREKIFHKMPDMVYVPTNEVFVVGRSIKKYRRMR